MTASASELAKLSPQNRGQLLCGPLLPTQQQAASSCGQGCTTVNAIDQNDWCVWCWYGVRSVCWWRHVQKQLLHMHLIHEGPRQCILQRLPVAAGASGWSTGTVKPALRAYAAMHAGAGCVNAFLLKLCCFFTVAPALLVAAYLHYESQTRAHTALHALCASL
jgi:hypothetical protein